jgi:hypothetical protein
MCADQASDESARSGASRLRSSRSSDSATSITPLGASVVMPGTRWASMLGERLTGPARAEGGSRPRSRGRSPRGQPTHRWNEYGRPGETAPTWPPASGTGDQARLPPGWSPATYVCRNTPRRVQSTLGGRHQEVTVRHRHRVGRGEHLQPVTRPRWGDRPEMPRHQPDHLIWALVWHQADVEGAPSRRLRRRSWPRDRCVPRKAPSPSTTDARSIVLPEPSRTHRADPGLALRRPRRVRPSRGGWRPAGGVPACWVA